VFSRRTKTEDPGSTSSVAAGMSLQRRLTVLAAAMSCLTLACVASTMWTRSALLSQGTVIDLATRQATLSETFAKDFYRDLGGGTLDASAAPAPSRVLFEATHLALRDGGETWTDRAMQRPTRIAAAGSATLRDTLDTVADEWTRVQTAADTLRTASPDSADFAAALTVFDAGNAAVLTGVEDAVGQLERRRNRLATMLGAVQLAAGLASAGLFAAVVLVIRHRVCGPLAKALEVAEAVAAGDLTRSCPSSSDDEIGRLSRALDTMCRSLADIVREIAGGASEVSGSASQLLETSSRLSDNAAATGAASTTVADSASNLSSSMETMASATEEMSNGVTTLSSAVEHMTSSIEDVARNAEHAAEVADRAAVLAESSNERIGQLGAAADAIGKVVEAIQDISEQTNLLALNATIEAARAGEAGKGFAVVASEVKDLARQAAEATDDIRQRIGSIQSTTAAAVSSIGDIGEAIREVNEASRSISSAVEQQGDATRSIGGNIAQTAAAAREVAGGVNRSVTAAQEITARIAGINSSIQDAVNDASQSQEASSRMSSVSEQLRGVVGRFQV
jgi:methyl-accepting chemotaxis protein